MIFRRSGPKPPVIDASDKSPASGGGAADHTGKTAEPVILKKKRGEVAIEDHSAFMPNPAITKEDEAITPGLIGGGMLKKRRPDVVVQDYSVDPKTQSKIDRAETLVEFLHPVNKLKKKVGESASSFDPGVFIKANEAVKNLAGSYIDSTAPKELREIGYTFQALEHFPDRGREYTAKMFTQAHEIKSGGGSYGFPLISRIADSLCKLTEGMNVPEADDITLMRFHLDAMNIVVRKKIKGIGGEIGQLLAEGLEVIVAKRKAHDPSLVMSNITKFLEKLDGA